MQSGKLAAKLIKGFVVGLGSNKKKQRPTEFIMADLKRRMFSFPFRPPFSPFFFFFFFSVSSSS